MATSVGTIAVNVTANTSGLSKNLNKARSQLGRFNRGVKKTLGPLIKFAAVAGGIGAAGGIAAAFAMGIRKATSELDELAKTSQKLGMATDSLAALHHAGELTGVSARTMSMGWQRATRRIAEAAKGTGEAKDAIKELGLDARQMLEMPSWDRFKVIADAMGQVHNQADRVRLSMKLFDSEGVALVNTLALGSTGLQNMRRYMDALGWATTTSGIKQVEKFNDAVKNLKAVAGGFFRQFTIDIAPAAERIVNELVSLYAELKRGKHVPGAGRPDEDTTRKLQEGISGEVMGFRPLDWFGFYKKYANWMEGKRTSTLLVRERDEQNRLREATRHQRDPFFGSVGSAWGVRSGLPPGYSEDIENAERRAKRMKGFTASAIGSMFGSTKEVEAGGKKWRQKNSGAIENVAREFLHKLQKTVREGKFRVGVGLKSIAENREQGVAFQNQLPLLRQMFGLDKVVENAQQQAASSGRRPVNQALQANTMAGFTALRANMRGGEQREMKDILRKQLEAMVGSNGTNTLLLRVIDAIAKEQDIELGVEIP